MKLTELFQIDGRPMIPPDGDMEFSYEDVDAADAGRDEGGFMHRIPVRYQVGVWNFQYSHLTQEEYVYMESLFAGKAEFVFTHPDWKGSGTPVQTLAYRSKHGILWRSAKDRSFQNYQFRIIEC